MKRSIISTLAAVALIGFAGLLSAANSQAAVEGWGGLTVALDTDNGFAPVAFAEPDFAPAANEEVSLSPSIGRTVHLCLSEECAAEINDRRVAYPGSGNKVEAGEIVPMVIVKVWSETKVNGQAQLDGDDSLWCTSVQLDTATGETPTPGAWRWPERVA